MIYGVIGGVAALLYLATGFLLGMRLSRAGTATEWNKMGLLILGSIAALLHALILVPAIMRPEGINLGFFTALSCTGWLIAAMVLLAAIVRPVENLGIILLPFSAITLLLGLWYPSPRLISENAPPWHLELHIVLSIAAYALLAMAAVQACLVAVQDYRLRHRHAGGFIRALPPLVTMETLLFQMIGIGFALLSLALVSGFLFLENIFAQHLVHKTALSCVAWLVFALLLLGRWRLGWRGRKAMRWTLTGFAVLVLAYFGSELVLQLILQKR